MSRLITVSALLAALAACAAPELSSRMAFDPYMLGPIDE